MEKKNNILEVNNLSVTYGPIKAVKKVSLEISQGEFVALIGANGAGKSSLLKAILGINKVEEGSVIFLQQDITEKPTDRIVSSGLSLIPEGHVIFSSMSVLENLQLGAYQNLAEFENNLNRIFGYFPVLKDRSSQIAGTLSGGEQQMLSMGRALMSKPKLILVDEPSLGLAPKIVTGIFNILLELNKEGYSILLAEQNAKKALECSNRCYVMKTGEIAMSGFSTHLMDDPKIRQAYLGGN
ncbi:MAG: ABC transporter ATP-binding protein [Bacteroidales bacterium]|nr:ABC transporter ATP-binding protein [Bacteroidales bacterium]